MAVTGPEPRIRVDFEAVRLRLRRRAATKVARASRIATFQLAGVPHEEARKQLELSVEQYKRARRWLRSAVTESLMGIDLPTVDESLRRFGERHVEGVLKVGLLKEEGRSRKQIREQLGISEDDFDAADEWWRDAQIGGVPASRRLG